MKTCLALLLCVAAVNLYAQKKEIRTQVEYHDNLTQVKEKFEYYFDFWSEQNVKHGRYSWWNKKGKLLIECTYLDGSMHGTYIEYFPNGNIKQEVQYLKGKKSGKASTYSKQGYKISELSYANDRLSGICRFFFNDGSIKEEITYQDGIKDGPAFFYDKSGNLKKQKVFQSGREVPSGNASSQTKGDEKKADS